MTKARDLADLISAGNPLADGAISVSEVSGAAPTASPTFTGTVNVDGAAQIRGVTVEDSSGTTKGYVQGDADGLLIASDGVNNITFDVNAAERMRIDSSGNVGIGTSSPVNKLHVSGNITINNSSNAPYLDFVENADTTDSKARITMDQVDGSNGQLLLYTEGSGTLSERFRIGSSGQLGIGGATYGTSGQVLTSSGSGAAPTWADASSGGMTEITSGTIGSNAQYDFSLGSNWWNTYKYIKIIYLSTFQSGDPPSGTYHCRFRLNNVSTSIYAHSGQRGSTNTSGTDNAGRLTVGSPQDNLAVFIQAEIFTDGTHTYVSSRSASEQTNGCGFAENLISNQTPTSFNIVQSAFGSERYRFEGDITFYGVK